MTYMCNTLASSRSGAQSKAPVKTAPEPPRRFDADDILAGETTAEIVLDGQVYTLRLTKQRKLLLTK